MRGAQRRSDPSLQNAQLHRIQFQRADLGGGLAPVAIEDAHAIAWLEAQHAPRVVCFGTGERGERPLVRREIKTVHEAEGSGF